MSQVKKMKLPREARMRPIVAKPRRSIQIETEIKVLAVAEIPHQREADPNDRSLVDCPNTWWP